MVGHSREQDTTLALRETVAQIKQPDIAFIMLFCSVNHDLDALSRGLTDAFSGIPVIGCTTAGEIGPLGHTSGGMVAASFPSAEFTLSSAAFTDAQARDGHSMRAIVADAKSRMGTLPRRFAILFVEGLSGMEEIISQACQSEFGEIPVLGGSSGDDERYSATYVLHEGSFRLGQTAIAAISTTHSIRPFQMRPFFSAGDPLVITEADPRRRVIVEINGHPASHEYARVLGVDPAALTPERFANAPLIARINGVDFARAIRSANADGSLTLYCAIDQGLVLRVGRIGGDEFIVLLLEPESEGACEATLLRIVDAIRKPYALDGAESCEISVSIGYTIFPEDNAMPAELLEHADGALYDAKRNGKNRLARFSP